MTVYFKTPGHMNLEAALTFGISAKIRDDAIGEFGTGLKYAFAILLREKCRIHLTIGDKDHVIHTKTAEHRGKTFDTVYLDDRNLGFTTHLGKNWELWQAYRELYCNTQDEDGYTSNMEPEYDADSTVIAVLGKPFTEIHYNKAHFILEAEPLYDLGRIHIHEGEGNIYCMGILIKPAGTENAAFNYDLRYKVDLTEDRTLRNMYSILSSVGTDVIKSHDTEFLKAYLNSRIHDSVAQFENRLNTYGEPTKEFLQVAEIINKRNPRKLYAWAKALLTVHNPEAAGYTPYKLNAMQEKMLEKATHFCQLMDVFPENYDIEFVTKIDDNVMALADVKRGKIILSKEVFNHGTRYLASTLLEEVVHLETGFQDETRELQNFLFDKWVSLGEQIIGEPL